MNTTRFARYFALPIVSAGILGGAALGLASTASAASNHDVRPPDVVAIPDVRRGRRPRRCRARAGTRDLPSRGPAAGLHPLINITEALPEQLGEGLGALGHRYADRRTVPPSNRAPNAAATGPGC